MNAVIAVITGEGELKVDAYEDEAEITVVAIDWAKIKIDPAYALQKIGELRDVEDGAVDQKRLGEHAFTLIAEIVEVHRSKS